MVKLDLERQNVLEYYETIWQHAVHFKISRLRLQASKFLLTLLIFTNTRHDYNVQELTIFLL